MSTVEFEAPPAADPQDMAAGGAASSTGSVVMELNAMTRIQAAHYYRDRLGWAVHPLNGPDEGTADEQGKKPKTKGYKSHTADKATDAFLAKWFGDGSRSNLGIMSRLPYVVIDLDSKADQGRSAEEWDATHPEMAAVPVERTGGGLHFHVRCPDVPSAAVDQAGKGGKFVSKLNEAVTAEVFLAGNVTVTPSVHPSGHKYRWVRGGVIPEMSWGDLCRIFRISMRPRTRNVDPLRGRRWWVHYDGDLTSLDLVGVAKQVGVYQREIDAESGKHAIRCPWSDEHSGQGEGCNGSSTVVFQPGLRKMPAFKCLHASHADRDISGFLDWAESQMPGIVDLHCSRKRIWEEGQTSPDGRPRLPLPGRDRPQSTFAAEAGAMLGPSERPDRLFVRHDQVVEIRDVQVAPRLTTVAFSTVKPARAITLTERFAEVGVLRKDERGEQEFHAASMLKATAEIMLASPQFREELPRIDRILDVPIPIRGDDGVIRYPRPGYDPEFLTYLSPSAPTLGEMPLEEARRLFRGMYEEFCFKDPQSVVHALAAMITPFCRGLYGRWNARTPVFLYKANRERAGKDYLANLVAIVFEGRCREDAPLNSDVPESRKKFTSALVSGRRGLHMANCRGHIDNAAFEMLATAEVWVDRLLGENTEVTIPNELELSLSANTGLTYTADFANRCRIVALHYEEEDANARRFRQPDLHGWVRSNRDRIVSALAALVRHWDHKGRPAGPTPFTSFPLWARTVGGIMAAAGLGDPCLPMPDENAAIDGDRQTADMKSLFLLAHEAFGEEWVKKDRIYEIMRAEGNELFPWLDLDKRPDVTRFGTMLAKFTGRILGGIRLGRDATSGRSTNHTYQFSCVDPGTSGPDRAARFLKDVFGEANGGEPVPDPPPPEAMAERQNASGEAPAAGTDAPRVAAAAAAPGRITDRDLLGDIAERIAVSDAVVALDVETYGDAALNPWRGDIRMLSLAIPGVEPWLLDLRALGYDLGPLAGVLSSGTVLGHNVKFDSLWLKVKCGLILPSMLDTMTAGRLLTNGTGEPNDLGALLKRHLSMDLPKVLGKSDWGGMLLTEEQLRYCANDVAHLHRLHDRLASELEAAGLSDVYREEMKLLPHVVDMEARGVPVDRRALTDYRAAAEAAAQAAIQSLRDVFKRPDLNPASNQQLMAALASVGIAVKATGEECLLATGDRIYVPPILEWRAAQKRVQQAKTLLAGIERDGRIHGRFEPTGTETGRFSSCGPNMQNIGRGPVRNAFAAPPGSKLIVADYSQIELRLAAAIAGEERMIEAYRKGADLHRQTAALVLDKDPSAVTKEDRQLAKAVNFGLLYGQSPSGLVNYAQTAYGVTLDESRAREIHRRFFAAYSGLKAWHAVARQAARQGATEVRTVVGRRRLLPAGREYEWARFTGLVNTPVQGGSAEGIKRAIVSIAAKLPAGAGIVSTVHDELIVEAPEGLAADVCTLVRDEMVAATAGLFPQVTIEVEAGVCDGWGQKK